MNDGNRTRQHVDALLRQYPELEPWDLQRLVPGYDIPSNINDGWRVGNSYYGPDGLRAGGRRQGGHVVTRPEGYVPWQSVVQPDGRHAYDPNVAPYDQYPRTRDQELDIGRPSLLPQARQFEFMMNRSDNFVHQPGEVVTMGIDYDQMRTAAPQPMVDQYGRPVLPPGFVAPQGLMGPPPNPRNPAGGYGGSYGGQR